MPSNNMIEVMSDFAVRIRDEAPDTFTGMMKPQLIACDEFSKSVIFAFDTEPWMRNPGGAVHGGVVAESISMTINALAWYCAGQKQNPAISIQLSYPRPCIVGERIYVKATAVCAGRSMAYVNAVAWQGNNEQKPFAIGTGVHYSAVALDDSSFD